MNSRRYWRYADWTYHPFRRYADLIRRGNRYAVKSGCTAAAIAFPEEMEGLPLGIRRKVLEYLEVEKVTSLQQRGVSMEPEVRGPCRLYEFERCALFGGSQESPGFVVRDGFLGLTRALEFCSAVRDYAIEHPLHEARVGQSVLKQSDRAVRGDKMQWISDLWRSDGSVFHDLFAKVKQIFHGGDYDWQRTSVQLAMYPPNSAGYVEHRDTDVVSEDDICVGRVERVLTLLYYCNPSWKQGDGGELVIDGSWKIEPRLDRLVMFRSTLLHKVLPNKTPRWAITIWLYGDPRIHLPRPLWGNPRRGNDRIFVGIPSYCDPQCKFTIRDLFAKARNPENVYVGVYNQCDDHSDVLDGENRYGNHVRWTVVPASFARGPSYARHWVQKLFNGEEYTLHIDSHTRMQPDWDEHLKNMLSACLESSSHGKPMLTTYPSGFEVDESDPAGCILPPKLVLDSLGPPVLYAKGFSEKDGMLRLGSKRLEYQPNTPVGSKFWAAGFNFAKSTVWETIEYPPIEDLFFGEEEMMGAILWTHGVDFFAPNREVIHHLWTRAYRKTYTPQSPEGREQANAFVSKLLASGVATLNNQQYRLGDVRTLQEHERFKQVQ